MVTKSLILLFIMIKFFKVYTTQTQTSVPVVAAHQSHVKMLFFYNITNCSFLDSFTLHTSSGWVKTHTHTQLANQVVSAMLFKNIQRFMLKHCVSVQWISTVY